MRFSISTATLALAALTSVGTASPLEARDAIPVTDYDCIVIGGGPSGLSAASGLARVRNKVLLVDSGEYRNELTRKIHDVIAIDGTPGATFRYNARQLIAKYPTVTMENGTISSIKSTSTGNFSSFELTDSAGKHYTSRKIILATGITDILPNTPGVAEAWARGMYWCPWCDGYEHADQRVGILGSITDAIGSMLEIATLNRNQIIFANGTNIPENQAILDVDHPGWRKMLVGYNVTIVNTTIESIERLQDGAKVFDEAKDAEYDRFAVHLADNTKIERDSFITNFGTQQRSPSLGQDLDLMYYGDRVNVVAASMRTNVAGIWSVGDMNTDNSTNVPHAMFSGKKAAVYAHVELEKEKAYTYVETISKREVLDAENLMGRDIEDLWDSSKDVKRGGKTKREVLDTENLVERDFGGVWNGFKDFIRGAWKI